MIIEKNNLQTAQEWTKSYIELIASYVHPKTGNHPWSHLRAIMNLDHRRLIRPGKKIRPNFLRSTRLLCKILPKNLGACKPMQPSIPFIHHIWGETVLWGTVFIIQTSYRKQYFTICNTNCTHSIFRTMEERVGSLAKPSGSHFCSASCGECLN